MKKAFFRLLSYFTKSTATMSQLRFLPNTQPDYPDIEGHRVKVPQDYLKKSIGQILKSINEHLKPVKQNGADGIYLGTAGVSYMYYHLSKNPTLLENKKQYLSMAVEYLKPALRVAEQNASNVKEVPSFVLGNCGVYAVAAVVFNAIGEQGEADRYRSLYYQAAEICKEPQFLSCGSDELFVGRAGYVLGALWLAKETKTDIQKKDLYDICSVMVRSGRQYSERHRSPCPLMYAYYRVEYLGAAHGLCTILQSILSVPGYLEANPMDAQDVKASVDYILSLQDKEGNFPAATDEIGGKSELVHWCHGAPGVIYLMAKAYQIWREEKYVKSCLLMGDLIWERGLLKKGPGICHGVAGNGYAFLLLHRFTSNTKYLHRAVAFANFLDSDSFKKKARTPDHPFSLYEGVAGTACYLGDILMPGEAAFPFSDVFV